MKLIVISKPDFFEKEVDLTILLLQNDLEYYHLRKPDVCIDDIRNYINKIPNKFHNRIVLHSHYELIKEFNLKGIHFTEKTKSDFEDYATYKCSKSISCHTLEDTNNLNDNYNYAFLSPVFNSVSKSNYKSSFTYSSLEEHLKKRRNTVPLIALGGITNENICTVKEIGFNGIAILGSIWNESNINCKNNMINTFTTFKELCQ